MNVINRLVIVILSLSMLVSTSSMASDFSDTLEAARQGDADAEFKLAVMYTKGQGTIKNFPEAVSWFRLAAEQGHVKAQNTLGMMYTKGENVPQSYTEAVSWFRRAAEQGYAEAQFRLGARYHHGQGVPKDYAKAVLWYRLAAAQGYVPARSRLVILCEFYEPGSHQIYNEAINWYRPAEPEISSGF